MGRRKKEYVWESSDVFHQMKKETIYGSSFSLATVTLWKRGDWFLWLIKPGCCCFTEINVSLNRKRLFNSARYYLPMATMVFIDISISVTAGSNSLGVELGGFPPFKCHYECSFLYRINHLTHWILNISSHCSQKLMISRAYLAVGWLTWLQCQLSFQRIRFFVNLWLAEQWWRQPRKCFTVLL